jgi:hypothetical protein
MTGSGSRLFEVQMLFPKFRNKISVLFGAFLGILLIGCGGGGGTTVIEIATRTVSGTVTYTRLPLKKDDSGRPLGIEDPENAETLPLRGIWVRAVCSFEETMPDDSKVPVWSVLVSAYTDAEGKYSLTLFDPKSLAAGEQKPLDEEAPVFIEILSEFNGGRVRVTADPNGVNSQVPQADRVLYSMRKGLDGSMATADNLMPATATSEAEIELDFEIGLDDRWLISHSNVKYGSGAMVEPNGTGSKVAAIIDTAHKALTLIGNPSPGSSTLHLHYRQNIVEPLGTYVEYDPERFPLAFNPSDGTGSGIMHYFGSVRGGPEPERDDAWDEGALISMMARNYLRNNAAPLHFQFPMKNFADIGDRGNQLIRTDLQPTMAMAEGLPDTMAAIALKTPYLTSGSGTSVRDIRDISGLPSDIFSGPAIAAFTWEIALKANDIDSPGDPETWEDLDPLSIKRFYELTNEILANEEAGIYEILDYPSLFTQLARLTAAMSFAEPIDLAEIFTEEVIAEMAEPFFGEIWPRPEEGPLSRFIKEWGTDPDSSDSTKEPLPEFTFSMSASAMDAEGKYSNLTHKENHSAKIYVTKDTAYRLSVVADPPLPIGAAVELRINGNRLSSYIFDSSSLEPERIVLRGNTVDYPNTYFLDFSLKSPNVYVPHETKISVRLVPSY